jgi:hypothetical protein
MRENLHIFNWELSADDLVKIKKIPQRRAGLVREFVSEDRPDKTLEDLCDGEL